VKPKLILIGGGGHCASCIDVIEQQDQFEIAGIVDSDSAITSLLGYPILGNDNRIQELRSNYDYALITVGQIRSPAVRIKLFEYAKLLGFRFPTIVSPRAYVSKHALIGEGTIVMHDALINTRVIVGKNCIINSKALIEHDANVEDSCHVSTGAIVNGGSIIKQGTFVGSNAVTKESVQTIENDFIKAGSVFKGYVDA
jgi:sugar O-acyltransferase (sialic acid O-acetyltransferase NeuD family)